MFFYGEKCPLLLLGQSAGVAIIMRLIFKGHFLVGGSISMNKKLLALSLLLVLGGCVKNYKVPPLRHLKKSQSVFSDKKEGVVLRLDLLNNKQLDELFKTSLSDQQVRGFLLTIKNQRNQKIFLDYQNIGLPLLSTLELYNNLSEYSLVRLGLVACGSAMLGLAVSTLCTTPITLMTGFLIYLAAAIGVSTSVVGIPVVFLGSAFTGIDAAVFNQKLKKELKNKIVSRIAIRAGGKYSAIFVTRDPSSSFDIAMLKSEKEQKNIIFNVQLKDAE